MCECLGMVKMEGMKEVWKEERGKKNFLTLSSSSLNFKVSIATFFLYETDSRWFYNFHYLLKYKRQLGMLLSETFDAIIIKGKMIKSRLGDIFDFVESRKPGKYIHEFNIRGVREK